MWHSRFKLPEATSGLRGFEAFATAVDLFDLSAIPGPFQTEAYAGAVLRLLQPRVSDEDRKRLVEMRLGRQQRVYRVNQPPTVRCVRTEEALRPPSDDAELMREQVRYLYSGPFGSKLRILPAGSGLHEGMNGSFTVFTFGDTDQAAVYAEGPVCNVYSEDPDSVTQVRATFRRLWEAALTEKESGKLLLSAMKLL